MSKHAFAALFAAAALTLPAQADTVFKGVAFVTATSGTCPFDSVGDRWNMSYHPFTIISGTQTEQVAALNIFYNYGSQFNTLAGMGFTQTFRLTTNGGVGWSDYTSDGQSQVRIISTEPSDLYANTPSAVIVGEIKNKDGDQPPGDCVITFELNGIRG